MTESESPWLVYQTPTRLQLIHDHRWLKVIGIPIICIGILMAAGIWLIPGIDNSDAWPILAGGTFIGLGFCLLGLHLSLNLVSFTADHETGLFTHREGFSIFTRIRTVRLNEIKGIRCRRATEPGFAGYFILEIESSKRTIRLAQHIEEEPIRLEGIRWSDFLSVELIDGIDVP